MLFPQSDILYIENANSELQILKENFCGEIVVYNNLFEEIVMSSLLAEGVIEHVAMLRSKYNMCAYKIYKKLFLSEIIKISISNDNFLKDYDEINIFYKDLSTNSYLKELYKIIKPYYKISGMNSKIRDDFNSDDFKIQTTNLINNLKSNHIVNSDFPVDKLVKELHETMPSELEKPLLSKHIFNHIDNKLNIPIESKKFFDLLLFKRYLSLTAKSHNAILTNIGMHGLPLYEVEFSKYNLPLFKYCLNQIGIAKHILLKISDSQIIEIKSWPEFQAFLQFYFKIINEAKEVEQAKSIFTSKILIFSELIYSLKTLKDYNCPNQINKFEDIRILFRDLLKNEPLALFLESFYKRILVKNTHKKNSMKNEKTVFLVHGRDEALKETIARFLEKNHINVIILHEQPNHGQTIIEKFELYANVDYAIFLLTADDEGKLKGDTNFKLRARQNVILELGYFFAKLGRKKTCAIIDKDVETPSDISGILYLNREHWQLGLIKEMNPLGFNLNI